MVLCNRHLHEEESQQQLLLAIGRLRLPYSSSL
jgi:hypothetical protein